jgi:hypothetical protein
MFNSRDLKNGAVAVMAVMLVAGGAWAARAARTGGGGLLGSIPAKSMFCVRINNLDGTLTAVNEYLKGVAPESFDAQTAVIAKLGKMLGDEKLRGVNRKQNFAIFAVSVPGEKPAPGPMGGMFIGALIPVRNYDNFISRNPNCGQPDDEGISTITVDGKPRALATNFRRFAVLCPAGAREKLIAVKKMMGQRRESLVRALDEDERQQAASEPVWAFVNVKEAAGLIRPMFQGKLQQMKAKLQKRKESRQGPPMMVNPADVLDFYSDLFKTVMDGTDHVTIAVSPSEQTCKLAFGLKPVPGTDMAAMVGHHVSGGFGNMLGYLGNGATMNLAFKVDREGLKAAYMKLIDVMGQMTAAAMSKADLDKVKTLTARVIDAMGDSLALSMSFSSETSPAFSAKYIIQLRDQKAFEQVIDEELKMMEDGTFARLYKAFGMDIDFKIARQAGMYKGVKIDSAELTFKIGDANSPQSEMLKKMYGNGLDYRWAFVRGYCVYTIGGGAEQTIHELIDQVQAGGPKEVGSEMKAALAAIPGSEQQADVVGTFNYVRMLNVITGIMPLPEGASPVKLHVPTKSGIAFAGRTTSDGKLDVQMVLPKEHLQEIKSAFQALGSEIKKQHELQKQKKQEQSKGAQG